MIKRAGLFLLVFGAAPLFASLSLDQVFDEMENRSKSLKTIKFDFHQEIKFFNTDAPTLIIGEAIFQKPGKVHIQKQKPEEQLTVSDGKKIWVYTPAYKQVWAGAAAKWTKVPFLPKGIVPLDDFIPELRSNFEVRLADTKQVGGDVWLIAEPKDKNLGYHLEIGVSTQSWLPVRTVFYSETARIVTDLLNTQVNLAIPTSMFRFSPPHGAEVIPLN